MATLERLAILDKEMREASLERTKRIGSLLTDDKASDEELEALSKTRDDKFNEMMDLIISQIKGE